MADALKILQQARSNPQSVTFMDLKRLVVAVGFVLQRVAGSHEVFAREGVPEIFNLQPRKGDKRMAKVYQVEQVVDVIDKYNLEVA